MEFLFILHSSVQYLIFYISSCPNEPEFELLGGCGIVAVLSLQIK